MDFAKLLQLVAPSGPSPYRKEFLREQMCNATIAGLPPVRRWFVGV